MWREPKAVAPPVPALPGGVVRWDGRFSLTLPAAAPAGLMLGALGADAALLAPGKGPPAMPAAMRATLPALRDGSGVAAVPHLDYLRPDSGLDAASMLAVKFRPTRPLAPAHFTVV